MIEFDGKLTGAAKKFFYRRNICVASLIMLVSGLYATIGDLIVFYWWFDYFEWDNVYTCFLFLLIVTLLPCTMILSKRILPKKITIKGNFIFSQTGLRKQKISKYDVKKVYDYGEYYFIQPDFLHFTSIFVCQKELLTRGTIEDFEKMFEGKLK